MAASSSRQNSRFSSLNVFKFAGASKPPPLPPKDPFFFSNPSQASLSQTLSPDSFSSHPSTPVSSQYAKSSKSVRSPSPSPSYATSRATMSPPAPSASLSPESSGFRRGLFKLSSMGKRTRASRSPRPSADLQPPEPVDDASISMPWNFQHNIHVDENYAGLPPTWSSSLIEAGFSEEEITNIKSRRTVPHSPGSISDSMTDAQSVLAHPIRSSSLRRGLAGANASQSSFRSTTSSTPSMSSPYGPNHLISSRLLTLSPELLPQIPTSSFMQSSSQSRPSNTGTQLPEKYAPRTPPRKGLHVMNDSVTTISSPPPAYRSPKKDALLGDVTEELMLPPAVSSTTPQVYDTRGRRPVLEPNRAQASMSNTNTNATTSRGTDLAKPPRLSLHQDDLSSWSESLMSFLPSVEEDVKPAPAARRQVNPASSSILPARTDSRNHVPTAGSSTASIISSPPPSAPAPIRARSRSRGNSPARTLPPQKPMPFHNLPSAAPSPIKEVSPSLELAESAKEESFLTEGQTARVTQTTIPSPLPTADSMNPLWNEVLDLVRTPNLDSSPRTVSPDGSLQTPLDSTLGGRSRSRSRSPAVRDTFGYDDDELHVAPLREKDNRDSNISTLTVTPATIMGHVSIATRAQARIIPSPVRENGDVSSRIGVSSRDSARSNSSGSVESHSSGGSSAGMSMSSGSGSGSSGSRPQTLTTVEGQEWGPQGDFRKSAFMRSSPLSSPRTPVFSGEARVATGDFGAQQHRPSIRIGSPEERAPSPWLNSSSSPSPATPVPRYPGWVSEILAPLKAFIDQKSDPRELYADLTEIAEGESGSVYAARVVHPQAGSLEAYVAIKSVPILPSGSPKLTDLQRELQLMKDVRHKHVLAMDALYVDLAEDALWIRMELMERSLADVTTLVCEGIVVHEKLIARFMGDVLSALSYLRKAGIAHRDLRSDNLLVNSGGTVKIADFSNAIRVPRENPMRSDPAGVIYWQPPEMRTGQPYNALKVDVWSLGATAWEMAEAEPPFSDVDPRQIGDRWPPLSQAEIYSRSFHDFLHMCSQPSSSRPGPEELLDTPFIRSASSRSAVIKLLSQCKSIEEDLSSQGNVSIA